MSEAAAKLLADFKAVMKQVLEIQTDGEILDLRCVPNPLRSEYLSGIDWTRFPFCEGPGPVNVNGVAFSMWIKRRLSPDYRRAEGFTLYTDDVLEGLEVQTREPYSHTPPREVKATLKPNSFMVHLMHEGEVVNRLAYGVPQSTSFEFRHAEWVLTTAVIIAIDRDDRLICYTQNGSEYHLLKPFRVVERPAEEIKQLSRGFSPDDIDAMNELEAQGFRVDRDNPIY